MSGRLPRRTHHVSSEKRSTQCPLTTPGSGTNGSAPERYPTSRTYFEFVGERQQTRVLGLVTHQWWLARSALPTTESQQGAPTTACTGQPGRHPPCHWCSSRTAASHDTTRLDIVHPAAHTGSHGDDRRTPPTHHASDARTDRGRSPLPVADTPAATPLSLRQPPATVRSRSNTGSAGRHVTRRWTGDASARRSVQSAGIEHESDIYTLHHTVATITLRQLTA